MTTGMELLTRAGPTIGEVEAYRTARINAYMRALVDAYDKFHRTLEVERLRRASRMNWRSRYLRKVRA